MCKVVIFASVPKSFVNFRWELIKTFISRGCEVYAVAPGKDAKISAQLASIGVTYLSVPMDRAGLNPASDARTYASMKKLLHRLRPELVFAYTAKPVIYGLLAAKAVQVPKRFALISGLGYAFTESAPSLRRRVVNRALRALYSAALSESTGVFFQNPDDHADFLRLQVINGRQRTWVVNGSGVDLDKFPVSPLPKEPRFLLIGRLLRDKGVMEFAEAARIVGRQLENASFELVGPYDTNPSAISKSTLTTWEGEGILKYVGPVDDVRPVLRRASVFVLPSYREGTPRTVLEAMAMGRPIITTDVPGCRETVIEGVNGRLVPARRVDQLALAMYELGKSPALRERMATASRRYAEVKYDAKSVATQMVDAMLS